MPCQSGQSALKDLSHLDQHQKQLTSADGRRTLRAKADKEAVEEGTSWRHSSIIAKRTIVHC
jgi:hypothetical protein